MSTITTTNNIDIQNVIKAGVGILSAALLGYYFYTRSNNNNTTKKTTQNICPMKKSLNARLGGDEVVAKATKLFYAKVLQDDTLKPFFTNVNMPAQTKKQTDFNIYAFGGSESWYGRKLTDVHRYMGVSNANFDRVGELFAQSLRELNVSEELINEVGLCNEKYRSVVVTIK